MTVTWTRRPPVVTALWVVAALAVGGSMVYWLAHPTLPGMPWQFPRELADFRDTVYGPGGYLLAGHNPYDPGPYLQAHPWAQEFDPYAPAWLTLGVLLSPLPFPVAAALYLAGGLVLAVVLLRVLLRWTLPAWLAPGVPLGLAFLAVWGPGRYALQNGGTLLVMLGWVLVARAVLVPRSSTAAAALGVALCLIKPQFGLPVLVIALVAGRWGAAWRGVLGLAIASLPAAIACTVAAGGPVAFVESVLRDVAYATSPASSLGLASPDNGRSDLLGLLGRLGVHLPSWAAVVVPLLAVAACVLIVRRRVGAIPVAAGTAAAVLLGLPHSSYDLFILIVPFCLSLECLARRAGPPRGHWVAGACAAIPVLHLHRVSTTLLPALGLTGAETVDAVALLLALGTAVAVSLRGTPESVPAEEVEATP